FSHTPFKAGFIVIIPAENNVAQNTLEILVPETIQPFLLQKRHRNREFLAHDKEALIGASGTALRRLPALPPEIPGIVLELLHEIVIHDVVDAIHPNAINFEIQHPAGQLCFHNLPRRNRRNSLTGDWVKAVGKEVVLKEITAEPVAAILLRIIGAGLDEIIEEVVILNRAARAECHHHILEKPG